MCNKISLTVEKQDLVKQAKSLITEIGGRKMAAQKMAHLADGDVILSTTRIANVINGRAHRLVIEQYVQEMRLIAATQLTDVKL